MCWLPARLIPDGMVIGQHSFLIRRPVSPTSPLTVRAAASYQAVNFDFHHTEVRILPPQPGIPEAGDSTP
jgi:hypothetical protein